MLFRPTRRLRIETERIVLRPPQHSDHRAWADLRAESAEFLHPWEPVWAEDHLSRRAFVNRVYWAQRAIGNGTAVPLFLFRRDGGGEVFAGAVTLDNIRRGPAQAGSLGYWLGERFTRQGLMREAIAAVVHYAFRELDLSRIEAACLDENVRSQRVLERTGFKYEGIAQAYLQIAGRWKTHRLYACLRADRRGRTNAG